MNDIERIRELEKKASEGPWECVHIFNKEFEFHRPSCRTSIGNRADADFLSESRTAVPMLLEKYDELKNEIEVLRNYGNKDCTAMADEHLKEVWGKE